MIFLAADIPKIRASLACFVILTAVGGSCLVFSSNRWASARIDFDKAKAHQVEIENRLRQIRHDTRDIADKLPLFAQLQERGIIGKESRLEWTEQMASLRQRHGVLGLRYEIQAQQALDAPKKMESGAFSSSMRVELELLHEGDLIGFLEELRAQARAIVRMRECRISRQGDAHYASPETATRLHAVCRIDWITLREPGTSEGTK